MDKRTRQQVARQAAVLPSLPETASALAVELHERAKAMLQVRIDNIEVTVNQLVDQTLGEVVSRVMRQIVEAQIHKLVTERVKATVFPELEIALSEPNLAKEMREQAAQEFHTLLHQEIDRVFRERVRALAPTIAENLAKAALEEVHHYYGAVGILAAEDGERK